MEIFIPLKFLYSTRKETYWIVKLPINCCLLDRQLDVSLKYCISLSILPFNCTTTKSEILTVYMAHVLQTIFPCGKVLSIEKFSDFRKKIKTWPV